MNVAICLPYRDRGHDPLRKANLDRVLLHWNDFGALVQVVHDDRPQDEQFNRSAAYNRAAAQTDADILVFAESDMLVSFCQIQDAIEAASASPGLVVPFTQYQYLTAEDSQRVRDFHVSPTVCTPEWTMEDGRSIGAINVLSRETFDAVGGYDESFEGSWWDDRAMHRAFDIAAGPTRWISGPAYHLHHLPGWKGDHLTDEDRAATARNKARYHRYLSANTPERIRELTGKA